MNRYVLIPKARDEVEEMFSTAIAKRNSARLGSSKGVQEASFTPLRQRFAAAKLSSISNATDAGGMLGLGDQDGGIYEILPSAGFAIAQFSSNDAFKRVRDEVSDEFDVVQDFRLSLPTKVRTTLDEGPSAGGQAADDEE